MIKRLLGQPFLLITMTEQERHIQTLLRQGRIRDACSSAKQAWQSNPDSLPIHYLYCVTLRLDKQVEEAQRQLETLLKNTPTYGRGWQEQAYCWLALQQPDLANIAINKAIEQNPALISAWKIALKLAQQHQDERQIDAATQQIEKLSNLPKQVLGAMDLMHEGKLALAEQTCRRYLQKDPHHPDAMCLLAELGIKTKVLDDAQFILETCIRLHPKHISAHAQLAELYHRLGLHHQAYELSNKVLELAPQNTVVKALLAGSQVALGEHEQAIAIYQDILAAQPYRAGIYVQLGHALKYAGQREQAIQAYQRAYQLREHYGDAYWSLANVKTYRFSEQEIGNMQSALKAGAATEDDKIALHFALGKAFEDAGDAETSFHHYQQGNKHKAIQLNYSPETTSQLVDLQIQHASHRALSSKPIDTEHRITPIFIVGLPRSGSTLVEQILTSHSQVDGTNELHFILNMAMRLRGKLRDGRPAYPANLGDLDSHTLARLGAEYLKKTQPYRHGAPFFVDKMPNNFMHIGLIRKILPQAKFIDVRRNPMACCFSNFKQLFGDGQEFSYSLDWLGAYYRDYTKLMDHWNEVLPGEVLLVRHEDVVTDLSEQVERILTFCGLPFEQACVDFHQNQRAINTPSSEQVRQPIYQSSMTQWKAFEHLLTPLSAIVK